MTCARASRTPDGRTGSRCSDHSQGVQLEVMQELARYWAGPYDWRKCEARLQALPHFMTEIDGLDIHFIHVRSNHEHALPVIITHGWPGSIIELLRVIDPLTNPTAHGGSADDAFDVVIPSIPDYGYSGKPRDASWTPDRIAAAWAELMKRLGYTHYVAQGGDWGAVITDVMAVKEPPGLLGIHSNMPGVIPPEVAQEIRFVTGAPAPPACRPRSRAPGSRSTSSTPRASATRWRWPRRRRRSMRWRTPPSAWRPG